jgi:phosphohistidine phosphatase SixA
MKRLSTFLILLTGYLCFSCWTLTAKCLENDEKPTTVFIVRHAEKAKSPVDNPPLTNEGEQRARTLAYMLNHAGISAVFSTNTTRTVETVNNFANSKGMPVQSYETVEDIKRIIQSDYRGKTVLVAGHSNTIPEMIRALGIASPPNIDNEYNNLFILMIHSDKKSALITLKFEIFPDI